MAKRKFDIQEVYNIINNKYGSISTDISNYTIYKKFEVLCSNNHSFLTNIAYIRQGSWCPECKKKACISNEDIDKAINDRNGKLLNSYVDSRTKLQIECSFGHEFEVIPYNLVKTGAWCQQCIQYRSEEICRLAFETLFNVEFPKYRPKDLKGIKGKGLELDGFCKELNLAFEHHGEQHYVDYWRRTSNSTENTKNNDFDKQKVCKDKGIEIIYIPQLYKWTSIDQLESLIKDAANKYNINIKENYEYNFSTVSKVEYAKNRLNVVKNIALERGGKCLATEYIHVDEKMLFQCKKEHEWMASYNKIVNEDSWCPKCSHIKDINLSKEKLEDLYVNQNLPLYKIAEMFNVSNYKISSLTYDYGLEKFIKNKPYPYSYEELNELFIVEKKQIKEIAKILNRDCKSISNQLIKFGLHTPLKYNRKIKEENK